MYVHEKLCKKIEYYMYCTVCSTYMYILCITYVQYWLCINHSVLTHTAPHLATTHTTTSHLSPLCVGSGAALLVSAGACSSTATISDGSGVKIARPVILAVGDTERGVLGSDSSWMLAEEAADVKEVIEASDSVRLLLPSPNRGLPPAIHTKPCTAYTDLVRYIRRMVGRSH